MTRLSRTLVLALGLLLSMTSIAHADLIGPVFPAPGGTTFSASGSQIGQNPSPYSNRLYSGFDPDMWDALYFNVTGGNIGNVVFDTSNAATATFTQAGNVITWFPTTQWTFNTAFGSVSTGVKLVTSFFEADDSTALLASDFVLAPEAGLPQIVLDISESSLTNWGGGYRVHVVYQTLGGIDVSDFYNSHNTLGPFATGSSGGFFYEEVPEPGSLALLGIACLGAAPRLRARRSAHGRGSV